MLITPTAAEEPFEQCVYKFTIRNDFQVRQILIKSASNCGCVQR
jgi:hypothetical protein